MKKNNINKDEIVIYKPRGGEVEFRVKLERETIWLAQIRIFNHELHDYTSNDNK